MTMTWKQFKAAIEASGVKDDDQIFYIDTGNYPASDSLSVHVEDKGDRREFTATS